MKKVIVLSFVLICSTWIIDAQITVDCDGDVSIKTTTTGTHFNVGPCTPNSYISQFGADFRINRYSSGNQWAYIQGRDNSGSNDIAITIRTQYNGSIRAAMDFQADGDVEYHYDFGEYSDRRLKRNINSFSREEVEKIYSLKPVNYNKLVSADSSEIEVIRENKSFGLIAQDLKEVYPDLVKEGSNTYLTINYIGLIPLLIEAVKYQQSQITDLQFIIDSIASQGSNYKSGATNSIGTPLEDPSILYQNTPNPFHENTEIRLNIAENVIASTLIVYDMQGTQIRSYSIPERGLSSVIIYGYELDPGMYMYSLITDSREVGTKRMILTD